MIWMKWIVKNCLSYPVGYNLDKHWNEQNANEKKNVPEKVHESILCVVNVLVNFTFLDFWHEPAVGCTHTAEVTRAAAGRARSHGRARAVGRLQLWDITPASCSSLRTNVHIRRQLWLKSGTWDETRVNVSYLFLEGNLEVQQQQQ